MNTQDQNNNQNDPIINELNNLLTSFQEENKKNDEEDARLANEIQDGFIDMKLELDEIEDGLNQIEEAYS